jgi:hypothetical protein
MGSSNKNSEKQRELEAERWTLDAVLSHIEVIYKAYDTGRDRADKMLQFARQVREAIKKAPGMRALKL